MLNRPSSSKIWLLSFVTFGLYFYYWCSHSRADVNQAAKEQIVPTCWYFLVPGLNYYWMWLYAGALQKVSFGRIKTTDVFLVYILSTGLVGFPVSFLRVFNFTSSSASSSVQPSLQAILITIGVVVLIAALVNAAGLAFFCNFTQGKINALPRAGQA